MATRGASGVVITEEAGTLARTGVVAATMEDIIGPDGRTDTDGAAGAGMIDRCHQNCQGLVPPGNIQPTSERYAHWVVMRPRSNAMPGAGLSEQWPMGRTKDS
jgi:hypothetical protein